MEAQKVRLTLDLDPALQRRLKAIAALRGVSLQRYCQTAIHRKLAKDEDEDEAFEHLSSDMPDHEMFTQFRQEIFGSQPLPGSSADLIREARVIRNVETDG